MHPRRSLAARVSLGTASPARTFARKSAVSRAPITRADRSGIGEISERSASAGPVSSTHASSAAAVQAPAETASAAAQVQPAAEAQPAAQTEFGFER
jgi:hypothetical protein